MFEMFLEDHFRNEASCRVCFGRSGQKQRPTEALLTQSTRHIHAHEDHNTYQLGAQSLGGSVENSAL